MSSNFHEDLKNELNNFFKEEAGRYPENEILKIDLHCHDKNSNQPDELLGRILDIPETWLKPETLQEILKSNGATAFTVTNHNNARSCYELRDAGYDILTGAEFTVTVPDFGSKIHVLAYGFTPEQEVTLEKYRSNLYKFQEYAVSHDIPTTWAHPLFHYRKKSLPSMDLFEKLAVVFQRFEIINGQRDTWQNILVHHWLDSLTPEKIDLFAKKHKLSPTSFLADPYTKYRMGGSDSHMGLFAGQTGTLLHVPELNERLKNRSRADLALEAIRGGRTALYGNTHDSEKMTMAFIDYFCQIGINLEDPGLMRILFHKGDTKDKLIAMIMTNGFLELQRHKLTTSFIKTFHKCFLGKKPRSLAKLIIPKDYSSIFDEASTIAGIKNKPHADQPLLYKSSVENIYNLLTDLLISRVQVKLKNMPQIRDEDLSQTIVDMDIPSQLRLLFEEGSTIRGMIRYKLQQKKKSQQPFKLGKFLDGLSFPMLASAVITAATFASARVLYNTRPLLNAFAEATGECRHPKRMLWLTDTFEDKNGVAIVLKSILEEIRRRDLPIDILTCSSTLKSGKNLIVVPPKAEFVLPFYQHQPLRIPNLLQIHQIVKENEYDRLMCSTEGFMGVASLFLKKAYSIPAYFYVHTDWTTFGQKVLNLSSSAQSRMRRILRAFYKEYDEIFVLNSDQQKWLTSKAMGIPQENVHQTAHWVDSGYKPKKSSKKKLFNVSEDTPVLLFTGRISHEKGATELPAIYKRISKTVPGVKLVLAGTGPEEKKLQKLIPDALFLGWVDHDKLPEIYSSADLMILPSIFDTFGCVVLEALSCGTPVISYSTKGPKDIINHDSCGFLATNKNQMADFAASFLNSPALWKKFSIAAQKRALDYNSIDIFDKLLANIDLPVSQ
ncbi:MAG: glycosyltransferase [Spirochaetes bacterium]|jgi:glycosyltransferase involved in cell wall biosynthesis|nr:glycosyltransferase [Spirochaetota bacterium]